MTPPAIIQDWLFSMTKAVDEMTKSTLGFEGSRIVTRQDSLPWMNTIGAYIPIICGDTPIHLGIVSTPEGCEKLGRTLLGMDDTEELSPEDMADAVCEIVNILAGLSKQLIGKNLQASNIGLPIFINGYIQITKEHDLGSEMIQIGDINCYLIILHQRGR